ncbi:S1C family serine protease [Bradyrhizobium sp. DASA03007]|uniref:S1C family serine protease n=1 Tax=unclassified Bradyrhizobium TaxID=2631580 RepID=UPI003F7080AF
MTKLLATFCRPRSRQAAGRAVALDIWTFARASILVASFEARPAKQVPHTMGTRMKIEIAFRALTLRYHRASANCGAAVAALATISAAVAQQISTHQGSNPAVSSEGAIHLIRDAAPPNGPNSLADVAERVQPAVIGVISRSAGSKELMPFDDVPDEDAPEDQPGKGSPGPNGLDPRNGSNARQSIAMGSGFFISPDGYAVTNSHVVRDNDTAAILTSDKKTYPAKVVGRDSLSDLALIKVDGRTDFGYVNMAEQSPRVGDWVLTVGNPFGLGGTVTAGIVSAREREIENGPSEGFIQIDAPINSGDSGGPSLNTNGEVIGVNSMIFSLSGGWSGVAFAIPADTVRSVIPQLREKGTVTRGSMGAEVQSVTPEIADSLGADNLHGAIIANVQQNGPAAKAGLRSGDVVTSVDGQSIKSATELTKKVHAMAPGSTIQLAMVRGGNHSSLNVTLGQLPHEPQQSQSGK